VFVLVCQRMVSNLTTPKEYVQRQDEEYVIDVYQEGPVEHQNFMVSDGPRLIDFATRNTKLMEK
jgi:hypothetical protein